LLLKAPGVEGKSNLHVLLITTLPVRAVAKCCNEYISACLSVREDISGTTRTIFTKLFVHVVYGRGSELSAVVFEDTLCTLWLCGQGRNHTTKVGGHQHLPLPFLSLFTLSVSPLSLSPPSFSSPPLRRRLLKLS